LKHHFVFDQKATSRCFLARILWLQGFPDQAMNIVESVIEVAMSGSDKLSLCQALVQAACPVGLFVGDLEKVERFAGLLLDYSAANGLDFWQAYGDCFKGVLLIRRGELQAGWTLLETGLAELRGIQYGVYYIVFLSEFAEASARLERMELGLVSIDEALERSERDEARWYTSELLRIKGEIVLGSGAPNAAAEAETYFQDSLAYAREQQTLSLELRSAMSLARVWREAGRSAAAQDLVLPIYERFVEGFDTQSTRRNIRHHHRRCGLASSPREPGF
jgi:hypothetical protein